MKITPLDIQQQQFKTRFRGFDVREVDTFLEQMADVFESLQSENKRFRKEIKRLQLEGQGYREREESFKRAMLNSQKVLEQMKQNARKSAELVVAEAEVTAEKILNRSQNRLAQLHEDITELKRQRMQIEVQIRSVIESHSKLLEIGKEDASIREEEDDKLKLLRHSE
ncbi:MAG: DivIVA domain-containing protein [Deltaproteobacteria bacterium]|jgi:cell division initiation protein|nr:DivIVA domain-containing protein [Deltaproteobacteria bacterium]NOQ19963.1 DivIVA domain-containing protein [Desulfobacterales bacterium]MBW2239244.1 DivIVA domain-containing protein [Deltaproteobacteria bacterium]MBW2571232.1 DivIVA domain-containing protein [Deltaproteobacteria bacterium]MBW2668430.1 DivIVA domain-containing protein [Deltaproteobacteria bacterium]